MGEYHKRYIRSLFDTEEDYQDYINRKIHISWKSCAQTVFSGIYDFENLIDEKGTISNSDKEDIMDFFCSYAKEREREIDNLEKNRIQVPSKEETKETVCSKSLNKKHTLKKTLPFYAVCALLLVTVCAMGIYSYNLKTELDDLSEWNDMISSRNESQKKEIQELKNEKTELENEINTLKTRNGDLADYLPDAIFLYNNIGFIVSGSNRYHNYECPIFKNADEYWAHNVEYCEYLGHSKCKDCW